MIKFTVITVTYNAGDTIRQTIDSVFAQTYTRVEHLIIDGCSSDNTMAEIQHYVERNTNERHPHQIVLVREPDNGIYDAMNKGLAIAKGDYVVFLNAGDRFHSTNVLDEIATQVEGHYNPSRQPAVVYGETDLVDNEGCFLRHRRLKAPERLTSQSFINGMLVCHQSFYVRMDIARALPYDLRFRFSSDYDWCIRVMRRAERRGLALHNTKIILTDYLAEGMTTRNHRSSLMERFHIMAKHYGWLKAISAHAWFVIRAIIKR